MAMPLSCCHHYHAISACGWRAGFPSHFTRGCGSGVSSSILPRYFPTLDELATRQQLQRLRQHYRGKATGYSEFAGLQSTGVTDRPRRMKTRKSNGTYKMEMIRRKFPNHTEIAYREAVSKLKYLLTESYGPKIAIAPLSLGKRAFKENIPQHQSEDYKNGVDDGDAESVISDVSKKDPSTRSKYYSSRLSTYPIADSNVEKLAVPPAELTSFIQRQEEYIEQLERESSYCRDKLSELVENVREVIAENKALHQDKNKASFFKNVLEGHDDTCAKAADDVRREPSSRRLLEGPSIVFESRISELEAQLTQARLELRKARDENQEHLERLAERSKDGDAAQLHLELERALREKREFEARTDELQRELARQRARDADVEVKSKRAVEVAQQVEYEKAQVEAEVRRLREELERRQEKLREALQETNRRIIEEKQQVERRYSKEMEQLSAENASNWEAASKSHLEAEKQKREIAELKRELQQKQSFIDELKKEMQNKISKMQEELNEALAEKDASQEEVATVKLASERNERQARQEQSRLQSEISSYKMRLERADADLVHARRENLRLTEEISALEKEINMSRLVEETRVGSHPVKPDRPKDDKDKELASLIFDLENKQAKTVASLEDSLNKQASLVSRLTAECQSLTQRLEANDQKHKKEMANLQNNIEYLSNKIRDSIELREQNAGELAETILPSEQTPEDSNARTHKDFNPQMRQSFEKIIDEDISKKSNEELDASSNYANRSVEEQNYSEQHQENYESDYANQLQYNQYNQYDPAQYPEYFNDPSYAENQEYSQDQQYLQNEQYTIDNKENYKEEPYSEQDYQNYSSAQEGK
ncbi:serologically defined colon cancer antigen 8 homolog isoform X2 [Nasonia vitripennis]|uniref:Serologically defined colon cancer antigen 8 homolog n=1 Tax=Nasonia vitripennis TaxID=7425 RepID=A0A7M7T8K0_NASVI|nr:serologically defined colon cancer antigen 8 homolog isoform X2 [Nasonia vitripennis]